MTRREPDWVSELRVYDDEAEPYAAPVEDESAGDGLPLRWCALLTVLALAAAVSGGILLNDRRGTTVSSTVVRYEHPGGVDLTGCPRDDVCQPLPVPDGPLTAWLPPELAHATVLESSLLLDSSTSMTIRTLQLLTDGGLTMTVTGQCILGGAPVPARDTATEPTPGAGPVMVSLVRPGEQPGCSAALTVRVPADRAVPMQFLRQLADELPQRLVS